MSFIKDFTPANFSEAFNQLVGNYPPLQVIQYMLGPERILEYAHAVGVGDPALRLMVPPIPPRELRALVAAPEEPIFLWTGVFDANLFLSLFAKHSAAAASGEAAILDFGCGCGRLTRYLGAMERHRIFGSDINAQLVDWCRANLAAVDTRLNSARPPLPFEDREFDFVYSLSIFTHLPEHLGALWLAEMARVLKPGGILAFTTHGDTALNIVKNSETHRTMFAISPEQMTQVEQDFAGPGFAYLSYAAPVIDVASAGDEYGNSFVTEARIRQQWIDPGVWEIAEYIPGGLRGWQDMVVVRRKP